MRKLVLAVLAVFIIAVSIVYLPRESAAVPAFARQTGFSCTTCHYQYPKLSEFGIIFKNNGYRMMADSGQHVWDMTTIPLAAIIRAEGETTWGNDDDESKIMTEALEIILATAIGDHFSVFAALEQETGEEVNFSGNLSADNLTGVLGQLNIKVGNHVAMEWDNYSQMRRILSTNYLAMDTVGTLMMHGPEGFAGEAASIEAFGQLLSEGKMPTIRYKLAIHNVDNLQEDRASNVGGAYGFVTLSFGGKVLLGFMADYTLEPEGMAMAGDGHAIWSGGVAAQHMPMGSTLNTDVVRLGANAEIIMNKASILLAWNYQKRNENGMTMMGMVPNANFTEETTVNNLMAEILYQLTPKVLLGVREDYVKAEQGSLDGTINRFTVGAYNYFMPNVKVGVEVMIEDRDQLQPMMGKPMDIGKDKKTDDHINTNLYQNVAKLVFEFDF